MGYSERLDSFRKDMIRTLGGSISCPSVRGEAVKTAAGEVYPFGKGVQDALEHMLKTGEEMGFEVFNDDNYAGYIQYSAPEGGDGYFGIVGHLDVMPEGSGWTNDPFTMTERDGVLYGRGTSDDKGPVVACLYAMKAIKDEGIVPHKNIRLVLGLDEESGDLSSEHYLESCGKPDFGFTPDGRFPLVNGEMGIMIFELAQKFTTKPAKDSLRLTKLEGGTAPNAVPANARAVISGSKEQYDLIIGRAGLYSEETGHKLKTKKQGSALVIEAEGVAAHGARPELGLNAVSIIMEFLGRIGFANEELNEFIAFYNEHIGFDLHGERMGCYCEDEPSGPLIFNVGLANINEEIATLTVNIRYPVSCTDEAVTGAMEEVLGSGRVGIVTRSVFEPIYVEPDDPQVITMLEAYRKNTGDNESEPLTTGGGTYAKLIGNIICFGALFPGEENTMHQADEKLSVESFMKMAHIYADAIFVLCCE